MTCPFCYVIDHHRPESSKMKMEEGEQTTAGGLCYREGDALHRSDGNRYTYRQECERGHVFAVHIREVNCPTKGCKTHSDEPEGSDARMHAYFELVGMRCHQCKRIGLDVKPYEMVKLVVERNPVIWTPETKIEKDQSTICLCDTCLPVYLQETTINEGV